MKENKLSQIVGDWVIKNKKLFWKYEVSSYYCPYKISVFNLPEPSSEDIKVSPYIKMLNNTQKTQLSNAIKKACARTEMTSARIDVTVNYSNGVVTATIAEENVYNMYAGADVKFSRP